MRSPEQPPGNRSAASRWQRWGVAIARRRGLVLIAWLIVLTASAALYPSLANVLSQPDYSVDGSQSSQVERLLDGPGFHGAGAEQDAIVFLSSRYRTAGPAYRRVVNRVLGAARSQEGVVSVGSPYGRPGAGGQISVDGHSAVVRVGLSGDSRERFKRATDLQAAIGRASGKEVRAWLTGSSALSRDIARTESADSERGETIGVPLAFLILLLALGALGAAVVPLLLAGSSMLLTFGVIAVLGRVLDFDVFLLTLVTMIGVGIGIDYSLFIVSRFREELARLSKAPRRERRRIAHAVGMAVATSGRTILYSGVTVALALTSLLVVRAPVFREFVIGTSITVACTLTAALTLLPAVLAQLGDRVNAGSLPGRLQPADSRAGALTGEGGWARWAMAMMRQPAIVSVGVIVALLLAISPVMRLRTGVAVDLSVLSGTPSGKGAEVLARSFSAGMTAPIEVAVTNASARTRRPRSAAVGSGARTSSASRSTATHAAVGVSDGVVAAARTLEAALHSDRRVAGTDLQLHRSGALLIVVPAAPVGARRSEALVRRLRGGLARTVQARDGVSVLVGGWPAQSLDASNETTGKLGLVLAITLGMALLFLLVVFRSAVLPLKAVSMNLLATGATLGLVVLVFQDGHGGRLLGFTSPGFIQAFLPLSMFVLLFGLSMDYEIFLIRRMQEGWLQTGDNRRSVATGVEHTGRPISAAAAIMVAVFGSGMTANSLELKQFGFALAAAIAIDATLIRLVLVPALMCLMGARNWWLPDRLGHLLPRVRID